MSEEDFLRMTIDHHASGVEMAELGLHKNILADLKELCQKIVDNQNSEIAYIRELLHEKYDVPHTPLILEKHQAMIEELKKVEGLEFEHKFLGFMITHHDQMLMMIESDCVPNFSNESKELCQKMRDKQSTEIREMQEMLDQYNENIK